jgi:hypothetical protein
MAAPLYSAPDPLVDDVPGNRLLNAGPSLTFDRLESWCIKAILFVSAIILLTEFLIEHLSRLIEHLTHFTRRVRKLIDEVRRRK